MINISIPKNDLKKVLKVFARKIGLFCVMIVALYFDSEHLAQYFPQNQIFTNCLAVLGFYLLYKRSSKRSQKLMLYAVIVGFLGEHLFSVMLKMYTYRLHNVPLYVPLGHAVVYGRVFDFSRHPTVKKYSNQLNTFLYAIISIFSLIYLIFFNDVFGFIMTIGVFLMLIKRPQDRLFFLTMYFLVALLEIGGTAYGCWKWPNTAFGIFDFLPSNNPPSGISLFYFLLDISCFLIYITIHRSAWKRLKSIEKIRNDKS